MRKSPAKPPVGFADFVRREHAIGKSDREIADAVGGSMTRVCVRNHRKSMGLKSWRHSTPNLRQKLCERLKSARSRRQENRIRNSIEAGWCDNLRPREVQIVGLIWDNGPQTRRELARLMGIRKLQCGTHCRDYLASLQNKGLVVKIHVAVRRPGKNRHLSLYSLPFDIRRVKRGRA